MPPSEFADAANGALGGGSIPSTNCWRARGLSPANENAPSTTGNAAAGTPSSAPAPGTGTRTRATGRCHRVPSWSTRTSSSPGRRTNRSPTLPPNSAVKDGHCTGVGSLTHRRWPLAHTDARSRTPRICDLRESSVMLGVAPPGPVPTPIFPPTRDTGAVPSSNRGTHSSPSPSTPPRSSLGSVSRLAAHSTRSTRSPLCDSLAAAGSPRLALTAACNNLHNTRT